MNPDEHQTVAEQLAREAAELHRVFKRTALTDLHRPDMLPEMRALTALAQVHATLAVRAAWTPPPLQSAFPPPGLPEPRIQAAPPIMRPPAWRTAPPAPRHVPTNEVVDYPGNHQP